MVSEGKSAASFTLPGIDEHGNEKTYSLKDFKGKQLILYFYPKDNTPGCTQEACDFRDNMARLLKDAAVVGISPDSPSSHKKFREKQSIPYPLLSDEARDTALAYGAYGEKTMYGKKSMGIIRSTFLIGGDGVVKKLWRNVKVAGHVDEVLSALKD
jgi:peroxiredoxin Q/BCP